MYIGNQNILLVGEGDFSFSSCLARRFGTAENMVATSLDTKGELLRKYSNAFENLEILKDLECKILCGVDANTMSQHAYLKRSEFDRIVFNFPRADFCCPDYDRTPYAGFCCPDYNHYWGKIWIHQELVRGFLSNASDLLDFYGEVHVNRKARGTIPQISSSIFFG